jgi:hypothetical protein
MYNIWDSPAWKSLGSFTTTPGNLTFSYYIDWYNPLTNKISGKIISCGAIMMFCLNLPLELQYLPENIFFAGITPPPKEPTVTTITSLSDPIIKQLEKMWSGKIIHTFYHKEGTMIHVAVLPTIADLPAIRKLLGFAGTASHNFCSFCNLKIKDIDSLEYHLWKPRTGVEVWAAAEKWRQATTKIKHKEIFDTHGVRWSALNQLLYCDPVQHTILGLMHNWIEGILQHHARVKWGMGNVPSPDTDNVHEQQLQRALSPVFELEAEIPEQEMMDFQIESQSYNDLPSSITRVHSQSSLMPVDDIRSDSTDDPDFHPSEDSDSEASVEEDPVEIPQNANCIFDANSLSKIHKCLADAVIPSWMEWPPKDLGQKSHGKLKADQWLVLFSVFLPLILPEIWHSSTGNSQNHCLALLDNFYELVACTNIVCSYAISSSMADSYLDFYIRYRQSSAILFPNIKSRPNHHYAMHNADLLKFWGPLINLSEFPYERQNGILQKIKTNGHLSKFFLTVSVPLLLI